MRTLAAPRPGRVSDMAAKPAKLLKRYAELNAAATAVRERKRQADREAVAYVRPLASIVLDNWVRVTEGLHARPVETSQGTMPVEMPVPWDPAEVEALTRIALLDYKLQHPRAQVDATEPRLWRLHMVPRFPGHPRYNDPRFVVCRFCARALKGGTMRYDYTLDRDVNEHTVQCALESLAGLRTPEPPGVVAPIYEHGEE